MLALMSCTSIPDGSTARGTFEAWVRAAIAGDADTTFGMLSAPNRSEWLFQRLQGDDEIVRRWRGDLSGTPHRTDLDLWWGHCKTNRGARAERLPNSVLTHPSLLSLWREYFAQEAPATKHWMSKLEIVKVYEDETGATVSIRNVSGRMELYGMVPEPGGWKIDTHRDGLRPEPPR
jgi:hypothetical protein